MKLSPDEKKELRGLRAAFDAAGGRGIELADRIDELDRKARLLERVVTVQLRVHVDPEVGNGAISSAGMKAYLDEIIEIPQFPENEPEQGYWIVACEVTNITGWRSRPFAMRPDTAF